MTNKLKLLLLSIMGIGLGLSFCSAATITKDVSFFDGGCITDGNMYNIHNTESMTGIYQYVCLFSDMNTECGLSRRLIGPNSTYETRTEFSSNYVGCFSFIPLDVAFAGCSSQGGGSSDIDVFYNNGNSTETITCDGTQAIEIQGLSTITSTNTFTPYYNISYKDEDNQSLIESYSKDILYLENGLFKKTYTGNNDWILSVQGGNSESSFSGYLPTFEITGGINEPTESGNIFNNFAENSLKFTLSNIPSYIQYVILLFILFFILGFIRKFRRK